MLPFERHVRWAQTKLLPGKVSEQLLVKARDLIVATALLGGKGKLPGRIGLLLHLVDPKIVDEAAELAGDKLREINAEALAKRDYLRATLTRFQMDLEAGEEEQILLRSRR